MISDDVNEDEHELHRNKVIDVSRNRARESERGGNSEREKAV